MTRAPSAHGTMYHYRYCGCRCEPCLEGAAEARRRQREAARRRKGQPPQPAPPPKPVQPPVPDECLVCVDIEHLMRAGEVPEQVMVRMGYKRGSSVQSHLRRHGRDDLADKIKAWRIEHGKDLTWHKR